jgi:hypothetical protein
VSLLSRTLVDLVDKAALNLKQEGPISDEQRVLDLGQHALALEHRLTFADLQVSNGPAVLRAHTFSLAVALLEKCGQTPMFGHRLR